MIHKLSDVGSTNIGPDTQIWQYCIILAGARIGSNCNINCHCFVENDVVIGNNVTIKSGVYLWDGIVIEDNVFIGPNVTFTNDIFPRSKVHTHQFEKTYVRLGASVGGGSVILPGVTIGSYSLVGAGSVVTRDIGNNEIWYGNPARKRGYVCACGAKLDEVLKCHECNRVYVVENGHLLEMNH